MNCIAKLSLSLVWITLFTVCFYGCTQGKKPDERFRNLVLQVVHMPYVMTMYPRFASRGKSFIHLDIRKGDKIVDDAHIRARLVARDGDSAEVEFKQDPNIRTYFASLNLKHDEDYVVETDIQLKDKTVLHPIFSFHCGDPVPHVENDTEHAGVKE